MSNSSSFKLFKPTSALTKRQILTKRYEYNAKQKAIDILNVRSDKLSKFPAEQVDSTEMQ